MVSTISVPILQTYSFRKYLSLWGIKTLASMYSSQFFVWGILKKTMGSKRPYVYHHGAKFWILGMPKGYSCELEWTCNSLCWCFKFIFALLVHLDWQHGEREIDGDILSCNWNDSKETTGFGAKGEIPHHSKSLCFTLIGWKKGKFERKKRELMDRWIYPLSFASMISLFTLSNSMVKIRSFIYFLRFPKQYEELLPFTHGHPLVCSLLCRRYFFLPLISHTMDQRSYFSIISCHPC